MTSEGLSSLSIKEVKPAAVPQRMNKVEVYKKNSRHRKNRLQTKCFREKNVKRKCFDSFTDWKFAPVRVETLIRLPKSCVADCLCFGAVASHHEAV